MVHLRDIQSPDDLRGCSYDDLNALAEEIRQEIINTVAHRGGHLASNLGVVEITIAMHRVFHTPVDKLVFDVGHQSYVHKLLTGRYARFASLRSFGGLSGFPKRNESPHDCFETGHSSTAISAALGFARARDLQKQDYQVVALVGDGALTGGMCYEALNDAGKGNTRLIVVLNDNEMSISKNVGALSGHLTALRASRGWNGTKKAVGGRLLKLPLIGRGLYNVLSFIKSTVKGAIVDEGFFGALGIHYLGPIDGHDIRMLEKTFESAKHFDEPVIIHCITKKGHGYEKAEEKPEAFHGTPPFYVDSGDLRKTSDRLTNGDIAADELIKLARVNDKVAVVVAAMAAGTGMTAFGESFPDRLLDVGIAEPHAVTLAAGMAAGGMRPYVAVYSTFLQRGYDQVLHDVCLQHLPVCFLMDRAGLSGGDGATHHGVFDIAYLRHIPGIVLLAPSSEQELRAMIRWTASSNEPCGIRYPKDCPDISVSDDESEFVPGHWKLLAQGNDITLYAIGTMVSVALSVCDYLLKRGVHAAVVNCSTIKPLDADMLKQRKDIPCVTMEEHVLCGGFGSAVGECCIEEEIAQPLGMIGIPDTFVQHGSKDQLFKYLGLMPKQIGERILGLLKERNIPNE